MVKVSSGKSRLSSFLILTTLRLRHTWSGGNEDAWDGKGPGFESDRTCFFSDWKYSLSQKICRLLICLFMFCQLTCQIVELLFFKILFCLNSCFYCSDLFLIFAMLLPLFFC